MKELGRILREKREQLGLDLNELQTLTKIRKRYLMAIEEGDWSILPGDVYARGFVRSYAESVGLNGKALLEQYVEPQILENQTQAQSDRTTASSELSFQPSQEREEAPKSVARPTKSQSTRPVTKPVRERRNHRGAGGIGQAIAVVAALAILGGGWWALSQTGKKPAPSSDANDTAVSTGNAVNATGLNPANQSVGTQGNAVNGTSNQANSTAPTPPQVQIVTQPFQNNVQTYTVSTTQPIQVVLAASTGDCWVKVTADGNVIDGSDTISHGQTKTWKANQSMTIRVGNVPGVTVTINGEAVTLPSTTTAIDVQIVKAQA